MLVGGTFRGKARSGMAIEIDARQLVVVPGHRVADGPFRVAVPG